MDSPILYAKYHKPQIPFTKKILEDFTSVLANTTKTDTILDIGCGIGDLTKDILVPYFGNFKHFVAIDISKETIEFAREHYHQNDIFYEVLDIEGEIAHFKEKWNSFSRIVSLLCLQWVKNWDKAIANIAELLSDDGECLLYFITHTMSYDIYWMLSRTSKWRQYMTDVRSLWVCCKDSWDPSSECQRLMDKYGLHIINFEEVDHEGWMDNIDTLRGFVRSIDPFLWKIPEENQESYIEDTINIMTSVPGFQRSINGETKYVFPSRRTILRVRKNKKIKKDFPN